MTSAQFIDSLAQDACNEDLSVYFQALWYDANGDWNKAHEIVQEINQPQAARFMPICIVRKAMNIMLNIGIDGLQLNGMIASAWIKNGACWLKLC